MKNTNKKKKTSEQHWKSSFPRMIIFALYILRYLYIYIYPCKCRKVNGLLKKYNTKTLHCITVDLYIIYLRKTIKATKHTGTITSETTIFKHCLGVCLPFQLHSHQTPGQPGWWGPSRAWDGGGRPRPRYTRGHRVCPPHSDCDMERFSS